MDSRNVIKPRRMKFDTKGMKMNKFCFRDNSIISTFFYVLSGMFPEGERFFIHTLRHYQKSITDPELLSQVRGFIGQEAHHGICHEDLNNEIALLDMPINTVSQNMKARTTTLKNRFGPERQLALTVAMEHFTASLAEFVLENPSIFDDIPDTFRQMLIWHCIEEIEHKSVTFDVYQKTVNNLWMRRRVMVISMVSLFARIALFQAYMLIKTKHIPSWKEWRIAMTFFWGKKGILRANLAGLRKFFAKDFHPSNIDQNYLIENWKNKYPDIAKLEQQKDRPTIAA